MIMVARGDMGVEVGNHLVPAIQKQIILKCNARGIPVITATQMLESMTENPTPTRAEASDVANAIWDGTDAVMLSGETANGKYPLETIQMMHKIVIEAERTPKERPLLRHVDLSNVTASVMVAASMIAEKIGAVRILSVTESGSSCLRISQFRPSASVLGITNSLRVARRMCLYWGVSPFLVSDQEQEGPDFVRVTLDINNVGSGQVVNTCQREITRENLDNVRVAMPQNYLCTFKEGEASTGNVELRSGHAVLRCKRDVNNPGSAFKEPLIMTLNYNYMQEVSKTVNINRA